jgi:hypothetical protein
MKSTAIIAMNMISAYVAESFRQAAEDFAANPNSENWKELKRAMYVTQGWVQRHRPSTSIEPWLEDMLTKSINAWPAAIVERGLDVTLYDINYTE